MSIASLLHSPAPPRRLALLLLVGGLVAGCATSSPFSPPTRFGVGRSPLFPSFGDFNGDGKPDFVVARAADRGELQLFLGEGGGRFREGHTIVGANPPRGLAAGDLNGDGMADLAVADFAWEGSISVLLGIGGGGFGAPAHYPAGRTPGSPKIVDLTGDGKPDLVVVNRRPEDFGATWIQHGALSLLVGNGDGTFQAPRLVALGVEPRSLASGDWNGDGKIDLAVADDSPDSSATRRRVVILLNTGDGTFTESAHYGSRFGASGLTVADLNQDKKLDLIVRHTGVTILLGNGDGTFSPAGDEVTEPASAVAVGDFNGDGNPDIASARRILLGDGAGGFPRWLRYDPVNDDAGVSAADVDGDGKPDLLVLDTGRNRMSVYRSTAPEALPATP